MVAVDRRWLLRRRSANLDASGLPSAAQRCSLSHPRREDSSPGQNPRSAPPGLSGCHHGGVLPNDVQMGRSWVECNCSSSAVILLVARIHASQSGQALDCGLALASSMRFSASSTWLFFPARIEGAGILVTLRSKSTAIRWCKPWCGIPGLIIVVVWCDSLLCSDVISISRVYTVLVSKYPRNIYPIESAPSTNHRTVLQNKPRRDLSDYSNYFYTGAT